MAGRESRHVDKMKQKHTVAGVKTLQNWQRTFVLGGVGVILVALLAWQSWSNFRLGFHALMADDQTRMFEECRERALQSDAAGAADCLRSAFRYYPSGTKQQVGSHLDLIVERHRSSAAREIINHLRRITNEDLGDKPEPWITKYAKRE